MTPEELDKKIDEMMKRFDDVNAVFIAATAAQINNTGQLIPSNMHTVTIMASMNRDIAKINRELAKATNSTVKDIYQLYSDTMADYYYDPRFERALKETPLSKNAEARIRHFTESVCRQTANNIINLSNTTLMSETYRKIVDGAVLAVSSGLTDYKSATRDAIRQLGHNGLQMRYPSGYHRRLDTAVRQNIVDGANQVAQQGAEIMGEELGYDAYELSAHARSAPDHEPIQGRVLTKDEFWKLQHQMPFQDVDGKMYDAIKRPIGEWNCMHIAMPFSTQYSKRQYSDDLLKQWADANAKGCSINGKHYTQYQAAQLMRKLETAIRREKDTANAARIAGDDDLRKECQVKINSMSREYQDVARAAGLKPRMDRTHVEGFKKVKV